MTRAEFKESLFAAFPIEDAKATGGSIVYGSTDDISTSNPMLASDSTSINVLGLVFEPLLGASPIDGRPVPGLADSWTVSDDGLVYTFKINTTAKWHDGVDVTAEDVRFSFDSILNPNLNSPYRSQVNEVVSTYRVIDPNTFEITASDRFATFLYYAPGSVFIVPEHIWGQMPVEQWSFDGGSTGTDLARVVGTGPFKLTGWEPNQRVTLSKNADHYDTVPNIDEFVMVVQPEIDTQVLALEQGDIDLIEILPAQETARIQSTDGLLVTIYDIFQITYFVMNVDGERIPAFADARVRQAMMLALDRQSITNDLFAGFGQPAIGTHPPMSPAYSPSSYSPSYAYDPEAAKALLAEAGWTDSNGDGFVDKDGEKLSFSLIYTKGDQAVEGMIAYLGDAWKVIGLDVKVDTVSGSVLQQSLDETEYDVALLAFGLLPDGSQGYLFTCEAAVSSFNYSGYCNPEYDALDDLQKREFDRTKRTQMQIELSQMIWQDLPIGPIRFGVARTGYADTIHNFFPNGYGFLWSLPFVWVESGT